MPGASDLPTELPLSPRLPINAIVNSQGNDTQFYKKTEILVIKMKSDLKQLQMTKNRHKGHMGLQFSPDHERYTQKHNIPRFPVAATMSGNIIFAAFRRLIYKFYVYLF